MKLSQKQKANKKAKKDLARKEREAKMAEYLLSKGWKQAGPLGDVWITEHWKPNRELYGHESGYRRVSVEGEEMIQAVYRKKEPEPWSTDMVRMSLNKAYRNQLKLDASSYEKAKGLDDDLADLL